MLDESMFEDIHEIAENSAYLKAVEEKDVSLEMLKQLPPYEECVDLEKRLREEGRLTFNSIFHEPTGYYMLQCFLIADYAVDKATFVKDVEHYRNMRFESARKRIASLLYHRFVSQDEPLQIQPNQRGTSVFLLAKNADEKKDGASFGLNSAPGGASNLSLNVPGANGMMGAEHSHHQVPSQSLPSTAHSPTTVSHHQTTAIGTDASALHPHNINTNDEKSSNESTLSIGQLNNPIGVYGKSIKRVKQRVLAGEAPRDLFDEVHKDVLNDLKLDAFPRFLKSEFFRRYIRTKWIETQRVAFRDFTTFRVLGRGGFGAVHACRKNNSGTIYAMKCINKKLVKVKSALDNVLEERNVLTMMKTNFVTNLKYALQDEESLYLVMDLMLGGDLKFHLINAGRFPEKRARFYSAQVLLGMEHIHRMNIIYRDMKLENVLLDHAGHCKISDLGLAVVTKVKIKGYAGTPGYTAPEMIKNKLYGVSADIFSYGVMMYRMLCGAKPFKGKIDRDLDKAVLERKPQFPKEIFSKEATNLINGLLAKRPEQRLGCGEKGIEELKDHTFFEPIDWGLLESGYIDPPFVPNKYDVNAASLKDIGDFDRAKYRNVKLDDRFKARVRQFEWLNTRALQDEMVLVLEKADENVNFEKFSHQGERSHVGSSPAGSACCVVL